MKSIENTVQRNIIQNKAIGGGIKTKAASVLKTTATIGAAAANMISAAMPDGGGDDLSGNTAGELKKNAGELTDKSLTAVKNLAEKKIENFKHPKDTLSRRITANVKSKVVSRINNTAAVRTVRNVQNKVKHIEKRVTRNVNKIKRTVTKAIDPRRIFNKNYGKLNAKNVGKLRKKAAKKKNRSGRIKKRLNKIGKAAGAATRGVSGAAGTVSRVKTFTSGDDVGSNLAEMGKDFAVKGAELSYRAAKKVLKKPVKAVTKQVKKVGKRTLKKSVNKISKKITKKSAKTAAKATKRTIKTSAKTAKAAAKIIANVAKTAVKIAVQAIKAAAQAAVKIGEGIVALLSTPVGWIILAVVLVVVLIVILFNTLSGAAGATTSAVSGIGSSLSWLFGGDDGGTDNSSDIAELYEGFEETAHTAMDEAKAYYNSQISGIGFGSRDTLVFNGASFYPASSADEYLQNYFDNLDYGDYEYLMEMCYIKKLRDEREAQGLSETEMPEVTIDKDDIKNFLLSCCYKFNIEIIGHQSCPPANCCSRTYTYTSFCGGGDDCSNHDDDGNCLGHEETSTTYYCDHSHIKAVVTLQKVSKDELENDILALTDDERDILNLGLEILDDALQPQS